MKQIKRNPIARYGRQINRPKTFKSKKGKGSYVRVNIKPKAFNYG